MIGAQAGSTNPLRAPLRAAIAQVAPPLPTAPIASAHPRRHRPRRLRAAVRPIRARRSHAANRLTHTVCLGSRLAGVVTCGHRLRRQDLEGRLDGLRFLVGRLYP